jgi:[ribosomal protein S18]-alanine N-acetyltransferase
MTLTLRPMAPADLSTVMTLAASCPEAPHWRPTDYSAYVHPDSQQLPLLRAAWVAWTGSELHGFAAASLLLDDQQNRCELDSMAVHPGFRRHGIGTALLRTVVAWAAGHHAHRLVLEVRAGNAAALGLYQRFGLAIEGRRPRYYTDPEEDALLLGTAVTNVPPPASISTEKEVDGRTSSVLG